MPFCIDLPVIVTLRTQFAAFGLISKIFFFGGRPRLSRSSFHTSLLMIQQFFIHFCKSCYYTFVLSSLFEFATLLNRRILPSRTRRISDYARIANKLKIDALFALQEVLSYLLESNFSVEIIQ